MYTGTEFKVTLAGHFDSNFRQIIMICQSWNQNGVFKYLYM